MVHVYNCHPFASQQIVQVTDGSSDFSVSVRENILTSWLLLCCLLSPPSHPGDYLVTIEEKNSATYLRAYTNWRYQKARVGVRLLGHLLRGASVRGGVQMEIIEIPLSERPVAMACCSVTGDLLVGCENTLVLFTLRRQNQQNLFFPALDFERSVIVHVPKITPKQVALCVGYVAVQAELEVLVLKLETPSESKTLDESSDTSKSGNNTTSSVQSFVICVCHQELLGDRAKDCDIPVSIEKTGLEDKGQYTLSYVLFRCFFQGCSVEETQLHSLQLYPQSVSTDRPACVFCFFSLPTAGYLYSLRGGVELLSAYQYPEKVLEAVLTDHLLHVITKSALQCFTVRCAAVAARIEDPYIDTTMKACPPSTLEVCALRMQLFIGLRSVCVYGRHVVLLSTADTETPEETEPLSVFVSECVTLYVFMSLYNHLCVSVCQVEYSRHYAETNPQAQSLRHLLSEAHLLLRAALLQTSEQQQKSEGDAAELEEALRQNCAQLGDCFSRASQKDCHLALPYYRMSGLSVTEVMVRNRPHPTSPHFYGPGFLFYLKHYLLEEMEQSLSQESADEVIDIFSRSDPSELISVCASPSMINISPARTLQILQHLEDTSGVSVPLTITMANMMLRLDDLPQFTQLLYRHAEMLLVYGFIQEPRLLLHAGCGGQHTHIRPTALSHQLTKSHPGLLVAGMVALHENNKVQLEQADHIFKVCSLLCGPSLSVGSVLPLLERLSEETLWGFSLHLLCDTRRGQYGSSIEKLLDRCPQAIIAYANHQLQDKNTALWWQKLLPELCNRARSDTNNSILLAALKETLVVVAMETSPAEFLELIPDDGTAAYFLPHLLTCSQRHLLI
uniref:HPS3 biogenesis of lysosomal organelles complex 2 subunit 1 n=1 Tax=Seriola lalandi dorsalis TaxID=1841481 RepID=A0A3B4Y2D9_SERLL